MRSEFYLWEKVLSFSWIEKKKIGHASDILYVKWTSISRKYSQYYVYHMNRPSYILQDLRQKWTRELERKLNLHQWRERGKICIYLVGWNYSFCMKKTALTFLQYEGSKKSGWEWDWTIPMVHTMSESVSFAYIRGSNYMLVCLVSYCCNTSTCYSSLRIEFLMTYRLCMCTLSTNIFCPITYTLICSINSTL